MPSRTIRDTVLDSERYHACPVESRLLFLELLLCADDYALVPIGEVFLRRHTTACEGKTTAQIAGFLMPLMEQDLIRPYTSERGGRFAFIPRFDNRPRAIKPKWPVPPDDIDQGYIRNMIPKSEQFRISNLQKKRTPDGLQPGGETETETEISTTSHFVDTPLLPVGSLPGCPVRKIVATYNEVCKGCAKSQVPTATLHGHITARWRQLFADKAVSDREQAGKFFLDFFTRVQSSRFLTGQSKARDGQKPFRASLRWLMLPENFAKVIEGQYDDELQRQS